MRITPEVQARIRELLDTGMSTRKVAAEVGCCRNSVEHISSPEYGERARRASRESGAKFSREHPLIGTWFGILNRTMEPRHHTYHDYGGRGITIYPGWLGTAKGIYSRDGFFRFEEWMLSNLGPRPDGMTLDRIDNDGNYEPGNLKWSTYVEQTANSRRFLSLLTERDAEIKRLRARIAELEAALEGRVAA
jgi:hypothetical protein